MQKPEVSVLIPTYNRAHMIAQTIDRVLNQTYPHCHVVLVDDGSKDDTRQVITERYGSNPRVKYFHKPNGGVSSARNFGLKHVTGDYVAFLDSDDVWQPWKLEVQVAVMQALAPQGVGMLWTNMNAIDKNDVVTKRDIIRTAYFAYGLFERHGIEMFDHSELLTKLAPQVKDPGQNTRVYWGDMFSKMLMGNLCQPSTVMLTREFMEKAGPFNEDMETGEDHAYHLAAASAGPAALLDISSINYRMGTDDQLTQPKYSLIIAENYLRTILPVMDRERSRIKVPKKIVHETLASAYGWIGAEMFIRKNIAGARKNIALSLFQRPLQPRQWMMLALACIPAALSESLQKLYRRLK